MLQKRARWECYGLKAWIEASKRARHHLLLIGLPVFAWAVLRYGLNIDISQDDASHPTEAWRVARSYRDPGVRYRLRTRARRTARAGCAGARSWRQRNARFADFFPSRTTRVWTNAMENLTSRRNQVGRSQVVIFDIFQRWQPLNRRSLDIIM